MAISFNFSSLAAAGKSAPIPTAHATNHTVQFGLSAGVVAGDKFSLQGTIDEARPETADTYTWYSLATHTITAAEVTAGKVMFHVNGRCVAAVRGSIDQITAGSITSPKYLNDEQTGRSRG